LNPLIYNVASVVQNKHRDEDGQPYYHLVADDLCRRVEELELGFRFYDRIIWYKPNSNCCDNNKWGTFADPKMPILRTRFEYVLVWSYKQFDLPDINNVGSDITPEEYKEWSTNVWQITPYIGTGNPNPSAFPEKLVERIIKLYSIPGDWFVDPHCGSGTVPKVCKDLGRHFTGIDLQKGQCKYAKARISA
jgi:DNA modification methylase